MKRFLLPALLLSALTITAQDRMTPELLWSLKRVSGDGMHPNGKTVYYTARTYDIKTEKSTVKKYSLNVKTGEKKEVASTRSVFQRDDAGHEPGRRAVDARVRHARGQRRDRLRRTRDRRADPRQGARCDGLSSSAARGTPKQLG